MMMLTAIEDLSQPLDLGNKCRNILSGMRDEVMVRDRSTDYVDVLSIGPDKVTT
jgi:hypothetical protein